MQLIFSTWYNILEISQTIQYDIRIIRDDM